MHGEIGVVSEVNVGSVFWLRLARASVVTEPAALPAALTRPAALVPAGAGGDGHRLLYIEDNPVNAMLMEAMLARLPGLRLQCAELPLQGLEMARRERPDLILLDIQLPGMDGFEVLRRLRADSATRDIPVIAVSANAMGSDIEEGRAAGFADYLTKPIDLARLLRAVRAALTDGATA
jgi:CheY-like chemotaxis protein